MPTQLFYIFVIFVFFADEKVDIFLMETGGLGFMQSVSQKQRRREHRSNVGDHLIMCS